MQEIIIRKFQPQPSKLLIVDVDGDTKEFFDEKEKLIGYLAKIILEDM